MVRTVMLKEEGLAVKMFHKLRQLREEDELCDFILKVHQLEIRAHKVVLSAGSQYFKAMFTNNTKNQDGKFEMENVDLECMKICIDFIYSGNFYIPDGKIHNLLSVAGILQLDDVTNAISDILAEEMNVDNFADIRNTATIHNLKSLLSKCEVFYGENLLTLSMQAGFESEGKSHLIDVLKSSRFTDEEKLIICLRWVGRDSGRGEDLLELMEFINMGYVSDEALALLLNSHPFVSNDSRLHEAISRNKESKHEVERIVLSDRKGLQEFNILTGEITKFHNENVPERGDFSLLATDSYIYALINDKSFYRLNFKDRNSKWERLSDMLCDHGDLPLAVILSGSLFVIVSCCGDGPTADVEMYNPSTDVWCRLQDKPTAVCDTTTITLNDSIYCIGGWTKTAQLVRYVDSLHHLLCGTILNRCGLQEGYVVLYPSHREFLFVVEAGDPSRR